NRLDGLLMGVLLAVAKTFRPLAWERLGAHANRALLAGLALLALSFWLFAVRDGLLGNSIGWPLLSFGLALLVFAGSQATSWIGRRELPMVGWIAAISYSLYLSHKIAFHLLELALGERWANHGLLAFGAYALGSLAAAALLYYAVERPFLRLRSRHAAARRQRSGLPQAA
ncbi:MAG: acyltransferase, partial [Arenimonas sp.]